MIQSSIARRYARALFEAAGSEFEPVGRELAELSRSFGEDPAVRSMYLDPNTSREARRNLVEAVIAGAKLGPLVANLLRLLDDRKRILDLPSISAVYGRMVDDKVGRLRAHVVSAAPLTPELSERLRAALSEATRREVEIDTTQDRSLLGGVIAKVGNVVYDGSLRAQLAKLHRELSGQA
ncbi:MAG TPA: ATP synthase F1 subunit delta [Vulgatibacter sp.]|nr:ATP synthase F1 subunit delta [Vulgatibacter sp.]